MRRDRKPFVVGGVVALAIVVVGGLVFWLLRPSPDTPDSASTNPTTTTLVSPSLDVADAAVQGRLLRRLPPGYPTGACKPVASPKDALAQLNCETNSDPGGPVSSTYTLVRDKAALGGAFDAIVFDAIVHASNVVNCPGNIQSTGARGAATRRHSRPAARLSAAFNRTCRR